MCLNTRWCKTIYIKMYSSSIRLVEITLCMPWLRPIPTQSWPIGMVNSLSDMRPPILWSIYGKIKATVNNSRGSKRSTQMTLQASVISWSTTSTHCSLMVFWHWRTSRHSRKTRSPLNGTPTLRRRSSRRSPSMSRSPVMQSPGCSCLIWLLNFWLKSPRNVQDPLSPKNLPGSSQKP